MDINLLTITTDELLEKFGAGGHKPGSGSAAAFQGMLSAKLLVTVITLTNKEKRRETYKKHLPKLLKMQSQIRERIFPELTKLFHQDAIQFLKTIEIRKSRDKERDAINKNSLTRKALGELKIAIDIPLTIANLCLELSEISEFVFDNAFQSVRGDSQVAFSGAVSALAGCLAIIQLNLLSFGSDELEWTNKVNLQYIVLKTKHGELNTLANSKIELLEKEVKEKTVFYTEVNKLLATVQLNSNPSDSQVEKFAIALQRLIWKNRNRIWKEITPKDPIQILAPEYIFKKALGYQFSDSKELESSGMNEVAGIIDQQNKLVLISSLLPKHTRNFTAAHELGHAIMHKQSVMHRDLPLDGSNRSLTKEERQADKFAAYFLMPAKPVKELFELLFQTKKFVIDQSSAFNLTQGNISNLRSKCGNLRGLSRKLAAADSYGSEFFRSMAEIFCVSEEAMAIRLEELNLVQF